MVAPEILPRHLRSNEITYAKGQPTVDARDFWETEKQIGQVRDAIAAHIVSSADELAVVC